MTETRHCLECGEPLTGRSDKKFCDDQCRTNYNNKLNSEGSVLVRNINNILRKNRRILESLITTDLKANVSKNKLINLGFNFNFFTHTYKSKKGFNYFICYDYAYCPLENDYYMVVKWGNES